MIVLIFDVKYALYSIIVQGVIIDTNTGEDFCRMKAWVGFKVSCIWWMRYVDNNLFRLMVFYKAFFIVANYEKLFYLKRILIGFKICFSYEHVGIISKKIKE